MTSDLHDALRRQITDLIDQNSRLRSWLEFVLMAEAEELDQWRNGDFAAQLVNGQPPRDPGGHS
jgi:hypothetical protein